MRSFLRKILLGQILIGALILLASCDNNSSVVSKDQSSLQVFMSHFFGGNTVDSNIVNAISLNNEVVCPVRFSHKAGFYDVPIELSIEAEGIIYYTLDGSMPGKESSVYKEPFVINQPEVVRVRIMDGNKWLAGNYTRTYLIGLQTSFPLLSLSTDSGSLWDPDTGIYVGLNSADSQAMFNPSASNYFYDFERPVHVEFFEKNGNQQINQDAGLRIFGGMTRMFPEKSLRIIARKKYGDNYFRYNFFPEKDIDKFKSLILRTSGNDYRSTRFRDAFTTSLAASLDIDVQASRSILLFLNGKFWGIYDLREKIDENFLESNHGADPVKTDLLQGSQTAEVGDVKAYNKMLDFMRDHDLADDSAFAEVKGMMDIRNYTNYILTEIYLNNVDARGNVRFWRAGNLDGRFRWILYDTDFGFGASMPASGNYLRDCMNPTQTSWYNPGWSTFLLRSLIKNTNFRNQFIQQACYLMSSVYREDSVIKKINLKVAEYELEMDRHLKKNMQTKSQWYAEVEKMKDFAKVRPGYLKQHLKGQFGLSGTYNLHAEVYPANAGTVLINGNPVESGFEGDFFTDIPMEMEANPNALYLFDHWEGMPAGTPAQFTIKSSLEKIKAFMKPRIQSAYRDKVLFTEANPSGIRSTGRDWVEISNNTGKELDLSQWVFADLNNRFVIPAGTKVKAGECIVLCRDTAAFREVTTNSRIRIIGNLPGGIKKRSQQYILLDASGNIVDHLIFNRGYFGRLPEFFTLVLNSKTNSNDFSDRWEVREGSGTPGNSSNPVNGNDSKMDNEGGFLERIFALLFMLLWA
jgi:hypothetical protein